MGVGGGGESGLRSGEGGCKLTRGSIESESGSLRSMLGIVSLFFSEYAFPLLVEPLCDLRSLTAQFSLEIILSEKLIYPVVTC